MAHFKKGEILKTYRKILDPMGYIVVEKPRPQGKDWQPVKEEVDKYAGMNAQELGGVISGMKETKKAQEHTLIETKKELIKFFDQEGPNTLTNSLYSGNIGGRKVINHQIVVVESEHLTKMSKLLGYLERLMGIKVMDELTAKAKTRVADIKEIALVSETGPTKLIVRLG